MATIKSALVLNDLMSSTLNKVNIAMNSTLNCAESLKSSLGETFNEEDFNKARIALGEASAAVRGLEDSYKRAEKGQEALNAKTAAGCSLAGSFANKISRLVSVYSIFTGAGKLLDLSDDITGITARLNLMNDGAQTTEQLFEKVFNSAQKSRGSVSSLASIVARMGNNVGIGKGKVFSSSSEVVAFSELIQKQMTIAGASASEADNAILQLSQGLSSGVLRGDELNSVFEQAPNLIQSIAKYLDVDIGKIREMAKDGKITADAVKNAMFAATDEINQKFDSMPMTWGQVCQQLSNDFQMLFVSPASKKITEIIKSDSFKGFINIAKSEIEMLGNVTVGAISLIGKVANFTNKHWYGISIVISIALACLTAYTAALAVHKTQLAIATALKVIANFHELKTAKKVLKSAKARKIDTAAIGVNTEAIHLNAIAKKMSITVDEAEKIAIANKTKAQAGFNATLLASPWTWVIFAVAAVIAIIVKYVQNLYKAKGETISFLGSVVGCFNVVKVWFKYLGENIEIAWAHFKDTCIAAINGIKRYFLYAVRNIVSYLNKFSFINIDLTDLDNKIAQLEEKRGIVKWANPGENWKDEAFREGASKVNKMTVSNSFDLSSSTGDLLNSISSDTKTISDSVKKSNDELKWIRDVAERDVINRFTTAEVKVDFSGMTNKISNDMDLDGIISVFTGKFKKSLETAAAGVY